MPPSRFPRSRALAGLLLAAGLALVAWPSQSQTLPRVSLEAEVNLSTNLQQSAGSPQIVLASDGTVHVVWEAPEPGTNAPAIYHRFLLPGSGAVWQPPLGPSFKPVVKYARQPVLAAAPTGGEVALAYTSVGTPQVFYRVWQSSSNSWLWDSYPAVFELPGSEPSLTFDPADPAIKWLVWIDENKQPRYARLHNNAIEFVLPFRDLIPGRERSAPRVAVDSEGAVYAAWVDDDLATQSSELVLAARVPPDGDFDPNGPNLTLDNAGQVRAPDMAARSSGVCLVWQESANADLATPQEVIMACEPSDPSENWTSTNISNTPARSLVPRLAVDAVRGPMAVWQERPTPEREILFRESDPPNVSQVSKDRVDQPALTYGYNTDEKQGYVHAVWIKQATLPATGSDVYYGRWKVGIPTPTPTATATATATSTAVPTATPTATNTVIPPTSEFTPTPGPSPTPTRTPTRTASPTRTATRTATPGVTVVATETPSATASPTGEPPWVIYAPVVKLGRQ